MFFFHFRKKQKRSYSRFEHIDRLFRDRLLGERERPWSGIALLNGRYRFVNVRRRPEYRSVFVSDAGSSHSRWGRFGYFSNVLQRRSYYRHFYRHFMRFGIGHRFGYAVAVSNFCFLVLFWFMCTFFWLFCRRDRDGLIYRLFCGRRRGGSKLATGDLVPNGGGAVHCVELRELQTLLPQLLENSESDSKVSDFFNLYLPWLMFEFFRVEHPGRRSRTRIYGRWSP
jgi:hypothetical protein